MNKYKTFGEKISPILVEIEEAMWEKDFNNPEIPNYTTEAFRASIKIFMSLMLDKMWRLQESEKIDSKDRQNMARKLGEDIQKLVKTYTGVDTKTLY